MLTMQFNRLTDPNDPIVDNICNVLKNAYGMALSNFFIYKDPNYKRYLCKMIARADVYIFYTNDYYSDKLTGVVLFEIEGAVVYMRNIIVDHSFTLYNIGSRIFYKAINTIMQERGEVDMLYLDAFLKNGNAINWYHSVGMKVNRYLYWYDITNIFEDETINISDIDQYFDMTFVVDGNGFKQMVFNNREIGTLVQERYLVIKTNLTREIVNYIKYCFLTKPLLSVCLMSNKALNLKLIERSAQLFIDLKVLEIKDY